MDSTFDAVCGFGPGNGSPTNLGTQVASAVTKGSRCKSGTSLQAYKPRAIDRIRNPAPWGKCELQVVTYNIDIIWFGRSQTILEPKGTDVTVYVFVL